VTCHDVREQLSALLDDALSTPERAVLDAHLATCAECRRELEQLRGTVALLGRLGPVHAPAGFVDRVVTQVYRPSRTRRLLDALFRPLRVKLPLEAAAVLLVGVAALYVYERTPEVQQAARQKTSESAPAPAPPGKAPQPETAAPTQLAPVEGDVARERTAPVTPPPAGTPAPPGTRAPGAAGNAVEAPGARADAKPEPMSDLRSEGKSEAKKEAEVTLRSNDSGATPSRAKVEGLAKSIEPSPSRAPAPPSSSGAALPEAAPTPPSEASRRTGGLSTTTPAPTASEGVAGDTAATAKSRTAAARLMRAADASGRLVVRESEPAEVALDALLSRLGATRVARRIERAQGPILIDVNVPVARYHELLEGLGHIGRWTTDHEPKTLPPQVRLEVAVSVEP
jgi:Putative zinc-finger